VFIFIVSSPKGPRLKSQDFVCALIQTVLKRGSAQTVYFCEAF